MRNQTSGKYGLQIVPAGCQTQQCNKHGATTHELVGGVWKCLACKRDRYDRARGVRAAAIRRQAIEAHQARMRETDYWDGLE